MEIFNYLILALIPLMIGLGFSLLKGFISKKIPIFGVWAIFICFLLITCKSISNKYQINGYGFNIERINLIISVFILFVSGIVHLFSLRYMSGDRKFCYFFTKLGCLTSSLLLMIGADNLILMLIFWTSSNLLLGSLMIHKEDWSASRNSGILMFKLSTIGSGCIALAIGILFLSLRTFSLSEVLINQHSISCSLKYTVLFLLITASLIQSGAWPFHKWLLSSLNSPTPVSGLMHAGLVNGGGFLLTRFAPLFSEAHEALNLLFVLGLISVVLGTSFKLIQNNVKRMLACSTMAQMGFMLMQCGLGLFSAALAHLFWHGLFKCYLFLNSGSAIFEKRELNSRKNGLKYIASLLSGLQGAYGFILIMGFSMQSWNTQLALVTFAWLAAAQIAYLILDRGSLWIRIPISSVGSFIFGITYGTSIYIIKSIIPKNEIDINTQLNPIHFIGFGILILISIAFYMNFFSSSKKLYTKMLNLSQNDPKTMNLIRNEYKY
jgi:NAD(P)H-quinone oxidoreductase subunit 5